MPADQMVADCDVVAAGGELQRENGGRAAPMSSWTAEAPRWPPDRPGLRSEHEEVIYELLDATGMGQEEK